MTREPVLYLLVALLDQVGVLHQLLLELWQTLLVELLGVLSAQRVWEVKSHEERSQDVLLILMKPALLLSSLTLLEEKIRWWREVHTWKRLDNFKLWVWLTWMLLSLHSGGCVITTVCLFVWRVFFKDHNEWKILSYVKYQRDEGISETWLKIMWRTSGEKNPGNTRVPLKHSSDRVHLVFVVLLKRVINICVTHKNYNTQRRYRINMSPRNVSSKTRITSLWWTFGSRFSRFSEFPSWVQVNICSEFEVIS